MSRHRIKALSYREDNFEDDYDSADPDEQERLEECTTEVLEQLQTGEPSVTASREEVREALWHYYNDVQKSVGYLRGIEDFPNKRGMWIIKEYRLAYYYP